MSLRHRCGRTWSQRDCRCKQAMRGEKDGCDCWNLARWQQQDEAVVARRCSDRGVVESGSGYGSEDSSSKGGGSGVVRSAGSSRQRLRRRAWPRRRLRWLQRQRKQGASAVDGGGCGCEGRWQRLSGADEEEEIKAKTEEGLAVVEAVGKRRRGQRGPARAATEGRKGSRVRQGLRQRESMVGRQQQQRCCAHQRCDRGGSGEGLATIGYALPRAGRRQWQGGTGGRQHRGVRQRSARLRAMGGSKDGDGLRGEDGEDSCEAGGWQRRGSRVRRGLRQRRATKGWPVAIVAGVGLSTIDEERRWWPVREGGSEIRRGLRWRESNETSDKVAGSR
ncbi:hypothetical protein BHM03_00041303 [Ensete ventricosum]|nr:hypothetical protein BHM03_00041303 [Ensete ventricosum]